MKERTTGDFTLTTRTPHSPHHPTELQQLVESDGQSVPEGGTITQTALQVRALLSDVDPLDSLRFEIELRTIDTPFTAEATHASDVVPSGDVAFIQIAGLDDETDYRWQARAVDRTGRVSEWTAFGVGADDTPDFQIRVSDAPHVPSSLGQFEVDRVTSVAPGDSIGTQTVILKGVVLDDDPNDGIRLEVEVQPIDTAFTGVPTGSSVLVSSGDTAVVTVANLADAVDYHWQARAVDQYGLSGEWVAFASTHSSAIDFRVAIRRAILSL